MIQQLRLKNFKAWDATHWETGIRLAPVTVVLGTNSSGKSSLLQPLRLIQQTIQTRDAAVQLWLSGPMDLGSFEEVAHRRQKDSVVGIGLDYQLGLRAYTTRMDAEFELVNGVVESKSLTYITDGHKVWVERTFNHKGYSLWSTDNPPPDWEPTRDEYRPNRGFTFSADTLRALSEPLATLMVDANNDLDTLMDHLYFLGPLRGVIDREVRWEQQDPHVLGEHGTKAVQVLLAEIRRDKDKRRIVPQVSRWLKHMELADALEISRIGRSMLYEVRIRRGSDTSNIVDVGMGVSQVLPILVLMQFVPEGSVILLDEPAAHLHPLAESKLAEALVTVALERKLQILVETHSEHLFRRLQTLIAEEQLRPNDCALYYVERDQPSARLVELVVDEYGRIKNWPLHLFGDTVGETGRQLKRMAARLQKEAG